MAGMVSAHVLPTLIRGGAESILLDLTSGLLRAGHPAHVCYLSPDHDPQLLAAFREATVECVSLNLWPKFWPAHRRLRLLLESWKPDILEAHMPRAAYWAASVKRASFRDTPLVYNECNIQEVYPRWAKLMFTSFLQHTDHVIVLSDGARRSFVRRWGWPEDRITTIRYGIDPARVMPKRPREDTRRAEGVGLDVPLIVNVANVAARKAQDVLVHAIQQLTGDMPDVHCWIVGSLELEPRTARYMSALVGDLGLSERVRFLGRRTDVADLLGAADLFVLSSRAEGLGLVLLEAMAAGIPCVATDTGGCPEVVAHGETGLIVPVQAPDALAEAIRHILTRPDEADRMGNAGRLRVAEYFTTEKMVGEHTEVFRRLVAPTA